MNGLRKLIGTIQTDRRVRFLMTGVLNTIFSTVLYSSFVFFGMKPHIAVIAMYPPSILHSYIWNKFFTFKVKKRSLSEAVRFILIYAGTFFVNFGSVLFLSDVLLLNAYVAGVIGLMFSTIASYLGHSMFSFREKR